MVSIIIPAYNTEKFIRECLDSALGQTFSDIEVVVVDDGSTDSTPEIIAGYACRDPRMKIVTQANGGLSAARNIGLDHAAGEWIVFLDSDDLLAPDAVAVLHAAAMSSGASFVGGAWIEGFDCPRWPEDEDERVETCSAGDYIGRVLYQRGPVPSACGKLFANRLFDGLRFREGILYEDLDIFYRLAEKAGCIALIPDRLYFYRKNPSSLTGVFSSRRFDVLDVTRRIEEYMAVNHPRLLPAARDRRLSANFNMLGLIAAHDKEGRFADVASDCWSLIKSYRAESLFNSRVRLKNKIGIVASYFGPQVLRLLSRRFYEGRVR